MKIRRNSSWSHSINTSSALQWCFRVQPLTTWTSTTDKTIYCGLSRSWGGRQGSLSALIIIITKAENHSSRFWRELSHHDPKEADDGGGGKGWGVGLPAGAVHLPRGSWALAHAGKYWRQQEGEGSWMNIIEQIFWTHFCQNNPCRGQFTCELVMKIRFSVETCCQMDWRFTLLSRPFP